MGFILKQPVQPTHVGVGAKEGTGFTFADRVQLNGREEGGRRVAPTLSISLN